MGPSRTLSGVCTPGQTPPSNFREACQGTLSLGAGAGEVQSTQSGVLAHPTPHLGPTVELGPPPGLMRSLQPQP